MLATKAVRHNPGIPWREIASDPECYFGNTFGLTAKTTVF
jgi:hypothetical protein